MAEFSNVIITLLETLDALGIEYAIGGSFASSAWGRPRQTHDLDIAVIVGLGEALQLASKLGDQFLISTNEIEEAFDDPGPFPSFQLLHIEETFKIDVFLLPDVDYAAKLMRRRRRYAINGHGADFASPEDIVIAKLRWFVLGNRVSDKQWNDILQVLEAQDEAFDYSYATKWATHFGVLQELDNAKLEAGF